VLLVTDGGSGYCARVHISVFRSARVITILTLASRVLGLVRDMAFSAAFGVGNIQAAFQLAFQIPNLFRRLFGEGALSAASIPVLSEKLHLEGRPAMEATAGRLIGLLTFVLTVLCVAAEVVVLVLFLIYRFEPYWALTLALTAIMLPYMVQVCLAAILGGIQNIFGQFALPAAMPILLNVFLIAIVLIAPRTIPGGQQAEIFAVAGTVIMAGAAQLAWQWFAVRRTGLTLRLSLDYTEPAIQRIKNTMLPMIAGLGAVQLNTLADGLIASWFIIEPDGQRPGMSILYFAQRLYQFPQALFMVALATAIFPALSRHAAQRRLDELSSTLLRGIRGALFIIVPSMLGLILVREPLVRALFDRGQFAERSDADLRVAGALLMYALGLWAYGLNQIVIRAFYALQDAVTPLKTAVASVVVNVILNLILVQTFLRESGLALATAIGAAVQVVILMAVYNRRFEPLDWKSLWPTFFKIALAALLMTAAVLTVDRQVAHAMADPLRLLVLVGTGAITYGAAAWAFRCPELRQLFRR